MARYMHPDALDGGLSYIRTNATKLALISAYTVGDSYATVNAAILAEATIDSSAMTLGSSGNDRTLTVAAQSDASANGSGGSATSHGVLLDVANSKVLYVTEESAAQSITVGNPVALSGFVITAKQPVAP